MCNAAVDGTTVTNHQLITICMKYKIKYCCPSYLPCYNRFLAFSQQTRQNLMVPSNDKIPR